MRSPIPGRGLALGMTVLVVSLAVVIPIAAIVLAMNGMTPQRFVDIAFSPRALAAYRLSAWTAFAASAIDLIAGAFIAAVIVRYSTATVRVIDALVDVPFALPTAVTGITLATLYGPHGWIGQLLQPLGIHVAYTPLGIVLALAFVGLPFVVRTVAPVIAELPQDVLESAASLGASPLATFARITLPLLGPALLTGFALALARTIGEYGSVIFIAGNMPLRTEVTPLVIVTRLEAYDYAGASAIALVSLAASFVMLMVINSLQRGLSARRGLA